MTLLIINKALDLKMVDYIVLAEFDIDKGSGVKVQYPDTVPGITSEELAEQMITEGAHNFSVVTSFFSVGRQTSKALLQEQARMIQNPQNTLLDKIFTTEMKQRLQLNYWLPTDGVAQSISPNSIQGGINRSLPEHLRSMQASGAAIDEAKLAKL